MVGIVIVSHSQKLAEGVKELAEMMANNVHIEAAGGAGLDEVVRRAESSRHMEKIVRP